jgi:hypothetical protein
MIPSWLTLLLTHWLDRLICAGPDPGSPTTDNVDRHDSSSPHAGDKIGLDFYTFWIIATLGDANIRRSRPARKGHNDQKQPNAIAT